jgi:hypothetical protein
MERISDGRVPPNLGDRVIEQGNSEGQVKGFEYRRILLEITKH